MNENLLNLRFNISQTFCGKYSMPQIYASALIPADEIKTTNDKLKTGTKANEVRS